MTIRTNERKNYLFLTEISLIILLACIPLFLTFPYRVNIFLSWEGAYRISQGELPFRDFGTPLGGMYWVIPGIFFKIFGAQMITLVKAQVFINVISGLAFRSILKDCDVKAGIRFVAVLLYCISFSFFNFWPWYNHTVIVYEFIAVSFLFKAINEQRRKWSFLWMLLAAFFTTCSFLTKQDAGAMAFFLCVILLTYTCIRSKKWMPLLVYILSFAIFLILFVAPFFKYGIGYWFNHGQPPHSSRISLLEIIKEFFGGSQWIKFYVFLIIVILIVQYKSWQQLWTDKKVMLFLLLTLGILGEAVVFAVTSYTPPDNNIFFHSFAIAFILAMLFNTIPVNINSLKFTGALSLALMLWWSNVYWKYIERIAERSLPSDEVAKTTAQENVVNKKTYLLTPEDTTEVPMSDWKFSGLKAFEKIYMPKATVEGIHRLLDMSLVKSNKDLQVLNMTELTPLASEIPYRLEKGEHYPLWYHLGVGMFNKQAVMFEKKIANREYDLVLFEYLPKLNNFYPFRVRDSLMSHYQKVDSFYAPRRGSTYGMIEVYIRP